VTAPLPILEAQPLREYLESVTGFSVPEDRWRNIAPRLLQRVALRDFVDTTAYVTYLKADPFGRHELEELLEIFTVRKTSFFRNPATFDVLAQELLPRLLAARSKGSPPPAIWSAGCSTGEEPYTIAMIARGLAPNEPRPCYILATDIVDAALRRARRGVYQIDVDRDIPERFRPLLDLSEGRAEVTEAVRAAVEFYPHNLVKDPYPHPASGSWDAIFCRNVIIYFGADVCRRVISKFWDVLAPGGSLFLGHSEVLWGLEERFDVVFSSETFYYRKRSPRLTVAPRADLPRHSATPRPPASAATNGSAAPPKPIARPPEKPAIETSSSARIPAIVEEKLTVPPPRAATSGAYMEKTPSRGVAIVLPFDLVARAEAALGTGDQEGAARTLRLAIARAPAWAPPRLLLGRLYADRGESDRAVEELEVAARMSPLDARVHMLLGMVRERKGEREGAEDAYRHAVYLEPDLASARYALAQIYRATSRPDRARRELRNLVRTLTGKDLREAVRLTDGLSPQALIELAERELAELGE
jgi:chemotaxis protein methyltransferase CheR